MHNDAYRHIVETFHFVQGEMIPLPAGKAGSTAANNGCLLLCDFLSPARLAGAIALVYISLLLTSAIAHPLKGLRHAQEGQFNQWSF